MGTRLGRYEVIRTLAKGTLTNLLLGRASGIEGFERHVAIKLLRQEHASDPACFEMFVNEARLAATLHHHSIVQVVDIGANGGEPFFAMEYVHGVDLRRLLGHLSNRNEHVPIQHVVAIITAAAAALHHAHEQRGPDGKPLGIVHRQVTPANLIVGYDGNVKIVDFGIAKAAIKRMETDAGILKGSAAYMAPEQCAGRVVDRRSDVFALGIVLYELATVRRLFKGANEFLTMSAVVNAEVPRPSQYRRDIPAELEVVMLKALARDPLARYQSAADFAHALERVARSIGVGASTTQLANYMKLQFGDQKEPWLDGVDVEADPETTAVDFDGEASGLAPPPVESVKRNAIPKRAAATKSSPIQKARSSVVSPVVKPAPPPDRSFNDVTEVNAAEQGARAAIDMNADAPTDMSADAPTDMSADAPTDMNADAPTDMNTATDMNADAPTDVAEPLLDALQGRPASTTIRQRTTAHPFGVRTSAAPKPPASAAPLKPSAPTPMSATALLQRAMAAAAPTAAQTPQPPATPQMSVLRAQPATPTPATPQPPTAPTPATPPTAPTRGTSQPPTALTRGTSQPPAAPASAVTAWSPLAAASPVSAPTQSAGATPSTAQPPTGVPRTPAPLPPPQRTTITPPPGGGPSALTPQPPTAPLPSPTENVLPAWSAAALPTSAAAALPTSAAAALPTSAATALPTSAAALPTSAAAALLTSSAAALPTSTAAALPTSTAAAFPMSTAAALSMSTAAALPASTAVDAAAAAVEPTAAVIAARRSRGGDPTAIVEPLSMLAARTTTKHTRGSRRLVWIGAAVMAVGLVIAVIVMWPGRDTAPDSAPEPVANANKGERSGMEMTARDYERARANAAKPEDAEPVDDEHDPTKTDRAKAAEHKAAEHKDAEHKDAEHEDAEQEPDVPATKAVATKAVATKPTTTKPVAKAVASKLAAKPAVRPTTKAPKRAAPKPKPATKKPATKKPATKKTPAKWNPDDLFLGGE